MKKVMMIAAIAAALVSCQSKGNQNNNTMDEGVMTVAGNDSSAVAVYEGILPAADGPGIQYVLSVDSVGPVSYTHLDVYKRQPFISSQAEPLPVQRKCLLTV